MSVIQSTRGPQRRGGGRTEREDFSLAAFVLLGGATLLFVWPVHTVVAGAFIVAGWLIADDLRSLLHVHRPRTVRARQRGRMTEFVALTVFFPVLVASPRVAGLAAFLLVLAAAGVSACLHIPDVWKQAVERDMHQSA
jgi:hypothetical protein